MARYKPIVRDGIFLPVVLAEQIQPGAFEFALDHLVDHELDLSALDAKFDNDDTGAPAYDPRVMLKIVLLAYSRGLISSRKIEQACTPARGLSLQRRRHRDVPGGQVAHQQRQHLRPARASIPALRGTA